jgi:hypothetical protein
LRHEQGEGAVLGQILAPICGEVLPL